MLLKVKQRIKKALPTIYKWFAIILTIIIAFVYGTFQPNSYTESNIIKRTESQIVETAHSFGLHEPEFVYNNDETFIGAVKNCIDYINFKTAPSKRIPSAIIIAMAGIESGWGTSRFAVDGNNLFGIRTWNKEEPQLKPLDLPNARFGVKKYLTKCSCVQDMIDIINRHPAYKDFRIEREKQYMNNDWNYSALVTKLDAWSTNPKYAKIIIDTIVTRQLP